MRELTAGLLLAGVALSCRQRKEEPPAAPVAAPSRRGQQEPHSPAPSITGEELARLTDERVIYLREEINDEVAAVIIAKLLFLEDLDSATPITLEINSPGGSVTAGLAIYETMEQLKCPVRTRCVQMAGSMAGVLLAAGAPGERVASPSCRVMLHDPVPVETTGEPALSPAEQRKMQARLKAKLEDILAKHTGQSLERVRKLCRKNAWLTGSEAKTFGLIDVVETSAPR